MQSENNPYGQPPGMTPPLEAGPVHVQPSSWPTVLGVVLIVHGALGSICACGGLFTMPLLRWLRDMAWQGGEDVEAFQIQIDVTESYMVAMYAISIIALIWIAWEIANGIGLCMRKPWARGSCMAWSVAELIVLVVTVAIQVLMAIETHERLVAEGYTTEATESIAGAIGSSCFSVVWSAALPIFLLIWFSRRTIKDQVAVWADRRAVRI